MMRRAGRIFAYRYGTLRELLPVALPIVMSQAIAMLLISMRPLVYFADRQRADGGNNDAAHLVPLLFFRRYVTRAGGILKGAADTVWTMLVANSLMWSTATLVYIFKDRYRQPMREPGSA